jgi:hypothetical protein
MSKSQLSIERGEARWMDAVVVQCVTGLRKERVIP